MQFTQRLVLLQPMKVSHRLQAGESFPLLILSLTESVASDRHDEYYRGQRGMLMPSDVVVGDFRLYRISEQRYIASAVLQQDVYYSPTDRHGAPRVPGRLVHRGQALRIFHGMLLCDDAT